MPLSDPTRRLYKRLPRQEWLALLHDMPHPTSMETISTFASRTNGKLGAFADALAPFLNDLPARFIDAARTLVVPCEHGEWSNAWFTLKRLLQGGSDD